MGWRRRTRQEDEDREYWKMIRGGRRCTAVRGNGDVWTEARLECDLINDRPQDDTHHSSPACGEGPESGSDSAKAVANANAKSAHDTAFEKEGGRQRSIGWKASIYACTFARRHAG